jgi:threonine dehydrogenase-like Zn-dependent dehydrogenase
MAKTLGAYATVLAGPAQQEELQAYAPYGYSIVADATGVPAVVQQAFQYIKPCGQYFQFGVNPPDATIQINPYDIYRHDWNIIGSFATRYNFHPSIAWLESGAIDVKSLVSHFLPLERFSEGFALLGSGQSLKVQHAVP